MKRINTLIKIFFLSLFLFPAVPVLAQDDLMEMLEEGQNDDIDYALATFKGTRVVNLQSPKIQGKGVLQYMFIHRFGAFTDDYLYNFLGLNTAEVRLQLDYSFADWLNLGLGYGSAVPRTYDAFAKYRLLRQSSGSKNMPVTVVGYSSIYQNGDRYPEGDTLPHNFTDRLSYVHQLIIARKFTENLSLEIVPTLTHFNLVNTREENNNIYSLGFAGRYKLAHFLAISVEYIHQLNPLKTNLEHWYEYAPRKNYNALSVGVDIETGGHVFQIFLTNSRGVSDPYVITQTPGTWENGDIHLGFNISRVFTIQKPEMPTEG